MPGESGTFLQVQLGTSKILGHLLLKYFLLFVCSVFYRARGARNHMTDRSTSLSAAASSGGRSEMGDPLSENLSRWLIEVGISISHF